CFEKLQSTCRGMLVMPWRRNTPATTIATPTESSAAFPAARPLLCGAAAAAARNGRGKGTTLEKLDADAAAMTDGRDMRARQYTMSIPRAAKSNRFLRLAPCPSCCAGCHGRPVLA